MTGSLTLRPTDLGSGNVKDDFEVFNADRKSVGCIMRHPQAPEGEPWFWTIRRAFSRRKQGFESPRGRQIYQELNLIGMRPASRDAGCEIGIKTHWCLAPTRLVAPAAAR